MRKSILSTLVILGTAGSLTACDFEQPEAGCIVQDASFALWWAKYDQVGAAVDGAGAPCTDTLEVGDQLGVWKFSNPDTGAATLIVRPAALANLGALDESNRFDSIQTTGELSTDTDENDFCTASNFNTATVNPVEEGQTVASSLTYTLANVKVYSSPSSPGTQMAGEVTYTKNGCVSRYQMKATWPEAPCDPSVDQNDPDNGFANCGAGSGVNPDFAMACEPVPQHFTYEYFGDEDYPEGRCVAAKEIPSLK